MEWPGEKTTPVAMQVWRRAADACLYFGGEEGTELRANVESFKWTLDNCENYRYEYREIIGEFISIMASASNEQALDMASAGIDALNELLLFRIDSNTIVPCKDAFILTSSLEKFETENAAGTKSFKTGSFKLPLRDPSNPQKTLTGLEACAQVDAWYNYGVLETSAAVLSKTAFVSGQLPAALHKKRFCLLGCTSELGPAKSLLTIPGLKVLGVCRAGKKLDDLIDFIGENSPEGTTLSYPKGGADLLTQGPRIAQWILDQTNPSEEIILMPLAYANGEKNVRLCVAMDLIIQRVTRQRRNTIICQYSSPTTVMVLPPTAASNAQSRLEQRPTWEKFTSAMSLGKVLQPSLPASNNDFCILNGIATAQGPNYILAKTLQMWRCMIAYYRDGLNVSAPFAPITRTESVVANESIAAVVEGMHHFEPMLAFDAGSASTLMAAILVSQVQAVNRPLPDMDEKPFTLFWDGSVHSGVWTCPYSLESISTLNWIFGKTYYSKGYIPDAALAKPADAEAYHQSKRDSIDWTELEDSQAGKPMPECVRERLDFM